MARDLEIEEIDPVTGLPIRNKSTMDEDLLPPPSEFEEPVISSYSPVNGANPTPAFVPAQEAANDADVEESKPQIDVKQYLSQKYQLPDYSEEKRQALLDTSPGLKDKIGAALQAIGAGFTGRDANAAGMSALKAARDSKEAELARFDSESKRQRERDTQSPESKLAQELAKRMGYAGDVESITAEQFKNFSPALQKIYDIEQRKLDRAEAREERRFQSGLRLEEKHKRDTEQDMQKLSKDVAGVQDLLNSLDEFEKELGFKLDDADTSGNSLKVAGKDVDLPGVSLPGVGRVTAFSKDGRRLQDAASKVFNTVLKDRSGAAVSNQEMERMKREFGEGKYNDEQEMVVALQRYKRLVNQELRNREAAYNPTVVEKYADQGGRTSKRESVTPPPGQSKVKMQAPDGSVREVPEDQVKKYEAKGAKRV